MSSKTISLMFYFCSIICFRNDFPPSNQNLEFNRYRNITDVEYSEIMREIEEKKLYIKTKNTMMFKVNNNYLYVGEYEIFSNELEDKSGEALQFLEKSSAIEIVNCFILNIINAALAHHLKNNTSDSCLVRCRLITYILENSISRQNLYVDSETFDLYRAYMLVSEYFLLKYLNYENLQIYEPGILENHFGVIYSEISSNIKKYNQTCQWVIPNANYNIETCTCGKLDGHSDQFICKNIAQQETLYYQKAAKFNKKKGSITITFFLPSKHKNLECERRFVHQLPETEEYPDWDESASNLPPQNINEIESLVEPVPQSNPVNTVNPQKNTQRYTTNNPKLVNNEEHNQNQNGPQNQTTTPSEGNQDNHLPQNPGLSDTTLKLPEIHIHSRNYTKNVNMLPSTHDKSFSPSATNRYKADESSSNSDKKANEKTATLKKPLVDNNNTYCTTNVNIIKQNKPYSKYPLSKTIKQKSSSLSSDSSIGRFFETSTSSMDDIRSKLANSTTISSTNIQSNNNQTGNTINSSNKFYIAGKSESGMSEGSSQRKAKPHKGRFVYKTIDNKPVITEVPYTKSVHNTINITGGNSYGGESHISINTEGNNNKTISKQNEHLGFINSKEDKEKKIPDESASSISQPVFNLVNNNYNMKNRHDQANNTVTNLIKLPEVHQNVSANIDNDQRHKEDSNRHSNNEEVSRNRNDSGFKISGNGLENLKIGGDVFNSKTTNIYNQPADNENSSPKNEPVEHKDRISIVVNQRSISPLQKVFSENDEINVTDLENGTHINGDNNAELSENERNISNRELQSVVLSRNGNSLVDLSNTLIVNSNKESSLAENDTPKPKIGSNGDNLQDENRIPTKESTNSPSNINNNINISLKDIGHTETENQKYDTSDKKTDPHKTNIYNNTNIFDTRRGDTNIPIDNSDDATINGNSVDDLNGITNNTSVYYKPISVDGNKSLKSDIREAQDNTQSNYVKDSEGVLNKEIGTANSNTNVYKPRQGDININLFSGKDQVEDILGNNHLKESDSDKRIIIKNINSNSNTNSKESEGKNDTNGKTDYTDIKDDPKNQSSGETEIFDFNINNNESKSIPMRNQKINNNNESKGKIPVTNNIVTVNNFIDNKKSEGEKIDAKADNKGQTKNYNDKSKEGSNNEGTQLSNVLSINIDSHKPTIVDPLKDTKGSDNDKRFGSNNSFIQITKSDDQHGDQDSVIRENDNANNGQKDIRDPSRNTDSKGEHNNGGGSLSNNNEGGTFNYSDNGSSTNNNETNNGSTDRKGLNGPKEDPYNPIINSINSNQFEYSQNNPLINFNPQIKINQSNDKNVNRKEVNKSDTDTNINEEPFENKSSNKIPFSITNNSNSISNIHIDKSNDPLLNSTRESNDKPGDRNDPVQINDNSVVILSQNKDDDKNQTISNNLENKTLVTQSNDQKPSLDNEKHLPQPTKRQNNISTLTEEKNKVVETNKSDKPTPSPRTPKMEKIIEKESITRIEKSKEKEKCISCKSKNKKCDCDLKTSTKVERADLLGNGVEEMSRFTAYKSGKKIQKVNSYAASDKLTKKVLKNLAVLYENFSADSSSSVSIPEQPSTNKGNQKPKVRFSENPKEDLVETNVEPNSGSTSPECNSSSGSGGFIDDNDYGSENLMLTESQNSPGIDDSILENTQLFSDTENSDESQKSKNLNSTEDNKELPDENLSNKTDVFNKGNYKIVPISRNNSIDENVTDLNNSDTENRAGQSSNCKEKM